jgi:hypothetical protein
LEEIVMVVRDEAGKRGFTASATFKIEKAEPDLRIVSGGNSRRKSAIADHGLEAGAG